MIKFSKNGNKYQIADLSTIKPGIWPVIYIDGAQYQAVIHGATGGDIRGQIVKSLIHAQKQANQLLIDNDYIVIKPDNLSIIWELANKVNRIQPGFAILFYGFNPGWGEVQFVNEAGDKSGRQFSDLDQLKSILEILNK